MEISKSKFTTIIWVIFLLGVVVGFLAHENRDSIEINNAAMNLRNHPFDYKNTTVLIQEDIYILRNDTDESRKK